MCLCASAHVSLKEVQAVVKGRRNIVCVLTEMETEEIYVGCISPFLFYLASFVNHESVLPCHQSPVGKLLGRPAVSVFVVRFLNIYLIS